MLFSKQYLYIKCMFIISQNAAGIFSARLLLVDIRRSSRTACRHHLGALTTHSICYGLFCALCLDLQYYKPLTQGRTALNQYSAVMLQTKRFTKLQGCSLFKPTKRGHCPRPSTTQHRQEHVELSKPKQQETWLGNCPAAYL